MLTISATGAIAQAEEPPLAVAIHVYNYAKLDAATLAQAEQHAQQVYRSAGIETEWVDCPLKPDEAELYPACTLPLGGTRFALRILTPDMEEHLPKDSFGRTWFPKDGGPGYLAAVCPVRAKNLADESNGSYPLLLGHLIAHELGHLLLGTGSHAKSGIMHVPWYPDELKLIQRGSLYFSTTQAKAVREEVFARTRLQPAEQLNRAVEPNPVVIVRLYNYAGVSGESIPRATAMTASLFQGAGLKVKFLHCEAGGEHHLTCPEAMGKNKLTIRLSRDRPAHFSDTFGFSVIPADGTPANFAMVFAEHIQNRTAATGVPAHFGFAAVFAHEIFHLLTGGTEHSHLGVMRHQFGWRDFLALARSDLRLYPDQLRQLHEAYRRRVGSDGTPRVVASEGGVSPDHATLGPAASR